MLHGVKITLGDYIKGTDVPACFTHTFGLDTKSTQKVKAYELHCDGCPNRIFPRDANSQAGLLFKPLEFEGFKILTICCFLLEENPCRRGWKFPNVKMSNRCLENYFSTAGNWGDMEAFSEEE